MWTIWDFSLQLQSALTKEIYRTLSEVSIDYNKAFLDRIAYNVRTLNVLAGSLMEMRDQTREDVMHVLQRATEDGGFTKIVVCDAQGTSYSTSGISVDISYRDYFQQAMQGKTKVSEPLTSVVDGERCIVIAVPIHKGEATSGVLFGVYPLKTAGAQLLDFTYYSEGYGFVVAPDGTIVLSSEHVDKLADEENLFTFLEKTQWIGLSMAELKEAIAKGESKSFAFMYNGERRFVSFIPTTINHWYTFSIASDTLMMQQRKTTNQIVLRLCLKLTGLGILLLAWIMLENRRQSRAILKANQQYQSLLSHINGGMIVATYAQTAEETLATYVSSGFTDMTGYTLEDIQTLYQGRYLDVILAEDRAAAFGEHAEQLASGHTYRIPYRIRKKDGSILWVMDNGYLVEEAEGFRNHSI
ncbi:MAG: cache domain-containing protein, partial [Clostridia bacterium]